VMPSEELAEVCTVSLRKMSSRSLSAIESLLRMTVATPVRVTTFPIGSSAEAGAAAGLCGAAGCAGWFCASRIRPEIAAILAWRLIDVGSSSVGEGIAKTFAVPPSMTQARSESANGNRSDVTMVPGKGGQQREL
jgi:hypothetical protein